MDARASVAGSGRARRRRGIQKVFGQVDRGTIAPVCAGLPTSVVTFPPYADTADVRQQLDARYRDMLRRTPSPAYVDGEGAIVWTPEYLRYRVGGCDDVTARAAVRAEIGGTYFDYVPGAVELTWDGEDRVQFIVHFPDGAMWVRRPVCRAGPGEGPVARHLRVDTVRLRYDPGLTAGPGERSPRAAPAAGLTSLN
jgi:hypothetical protein